MTTPSPRSPRLLLAATLLLTVVGVLLLIRPNQSGTAQSAGPVAHLTSSAAPVTRSTPKATPTAGASAPAPAPSTSASTSASASVLPPHGEGTAGDRAIQQALDAAWPADLDAVDERQLLTAGRALLRADATGVGRHRWPAYFARQETVAPAFATARFRIQAAIARQDGAPGRAVVHLVWAGTDRGGTHTDGRITDLHFIRTTTNKEGEPAWIPQPRT